MYVQNQSRVDQTYLKEICVFKINFLGTWHILKQLVCLKSIYYGPVNEICVFKINLLWARHILKQFVCWKSIYYGPDINLKKKKKKKKEKQNFMAFFYGWGSTSSRLEPLRGGRLLFTTKFPKFPGTHFINLRKMKGWVNLRAIQWFWTRDPWIGNPAP